MAGETRIVKFRGTIDDRIHQPNNPPTLATLNPREETLCSACKHYYSRPRIVLYDETYFYMRRNLVSRLTPWDKGNYWMRRRGGVYIKGEGKVESVTISVTLSTFHACDLQTAGRRKVSLRGEGRFLFMEERAIMRHGEGGVSYDAR